jgi:WD40 repeat protein
VVTALHRRLTIGCCLLILAFSIAPLAAQSDSPATIRAYSIDATQYYFELSPDGRTAAIFIESLFLGDDDDPTPYLPIRLLDLTSGTVSEQVEQDGYTLSLMTDESVKLLTGPTDFAGDVLFSPDGSQLISFHLNGDIYIWDVATGAQISYLPQPVIQFRGLTWMPNQEQFMSVSGGQPTAFALWNRDDFSIQRLYGFSTPNLRQFNDGMSSVEDRFEFMFLSYAITPDGGYMAAANQNDGLVMFDLADNSMVRLVPSEERYGQLGITHMQFTNDGQALYYADTQTEDRRPVLYRLGFPNGQPEAPVALERGGAPFDLSADNQRLVWVENQDDLYTLYSADLAQSEIVPIFATSSRVIPRWRSLQFTADRSHLIFSSSIDLDDSTLLLVIPTPQ